MTSKLESIRDIVNAPPCNIMILFGCALITLSFFRFDGITNPSIVSNPNATMLAIGCVMAFGGFVVYFCVNVAGIRRETRLRISKIKKGIELKLERTKVALKVGTIQDSSGLSTDTGVVLPVNTSFIDDCIRDKNSATGSYVLEFYGDKVEMIPKVMMDQLEASGYQRASDGTYPQGTTIVLPSPFDVPAKVLMTASTLRKEMVGIRAEPSSVCECVRRIFELTSDKKISRLRMPVLGSGHGGLDINEALFLLVLTIKYYSEHIYHHVKEIDIVIVENDLRRLKDSYIQHLSLLGEETTR